MTGVTVASRAQTAAWMDAWQRRLTAWYGAHAANASADRLARGWAQAPASVLGLLVAADGAGAGQVAVCVPSRGDRVDPVGTVVDLWVEPAYRGQGLGRTARDFAITWAREHAPKAGAILWGDDPGLRALFASFPLRYQKMVKRLAVAPELPAGVTARPMTEAEYPAWRANEVVAYAADLSGSGTLTPEAAATASATSYDAMLPDGLGTAGYEWAAIEADDEVVATIWVNHEEDPDASFVYSVEAHPDHRGKGYGRAAMLAGEAMTIRAGHGHLGLNVFGHNAVAIGLYHSLGYTVLDQNRAVSFT